MRVVRLDDDPTGTQAVHGLHMLLSDVAEGLEAFAAGTDKATYILTNTRAMSPADATAVVPATYRPTSAVYGSPSPNRRTAPTT